MIIDIASKTLAKLDRRLYKLQSEIQDLIRTQRSAQNEAHAISKKVAKKTSEISEILREISNLESRLTSKQLVTRQIIMIKDQINILTKTLTFEIDRAKIESVTTLINQLKTEIKSINKTINSKTQKIAVPASSKAGLNALIAITKKNQHTQS
jgi:chromosome segregation ATPase